MTQNFARHFHRCKYDLTTYPFSRPVLLKLWVFIKAETISKQIPGPGVYFSLTVCLRSVLPRTTFRRNNNTTLNHHPLHAQLYYPRFIMGKIHEMRKYLSILWTIFHKERVRDKPLMFLLYSVIWNGVKSYIFIVSRGGFVRFCEHLWEVSWFLRGKSNYL